MIVFVGIINSLESKLRVASLLEVGLQKNGMSKYRLFIHFSGSTDIVVGRCLVHCDTGRTIRNYSNNFAPSGAFIV